MEKSQKVFIDSSPGFQVAPHHGIFMEVSWFKSREEISRLIVILQ